MSVKGQLVVTCGPASAPIDEVRRITNHSTGRLGFLLSNRLAHAGWKVHCFRGYGATHPEPLAPGVRTEQFLTNDDLLERLREAGDQAGVRAVFHAAALTDFVVKAVSGADGIPMTDRKISSRAGPLNLTLEPARKVIGELRTIYPAAKLIGWKFEVSGTQDEALAKGLRQILENRTDACVVNGRAYGEGFGVIQPGKPLAHCKSAEELCEWLTGWLEPLR